MTPPIEGVRVEVVIYEDDVEVQRLMIRYHPTQEYTVSVVTDDGVDGKIHRRAGGTS